MARTAKYDAAAPEIRQYLRATLTPLISIYVHAMNIRRLRAFLCWRMHTTKAALCAAQTLVTDRLRLVARGLVRARQAEQITAFLSRVLTRSRTKQLLHGFLHWKLVVTQYAQIASHAPEYMHWIAQHPTHLPLLYVRNALLQCKATLLLRAAARCRPCRRAWHRWKLVARTWPFVAHCLQRLYLAFLLHRWHTYAQAKHKWRHVASTTCARLRTHRVRLAVQHWRQKATNSQQARTQRVVTRLAQKRLVAAKVFGRWQATVLRWHRQRSLMQALRLRLHRTWQSRLAVAWTRWSTALWRRQRAEQSLQSVLKRRTHRDLGRAVLALRLHSLTRRHCTEARHAQQQWRYGATAATCLRLWLQHQQHRLYRGFRTWQHHNALARHAERSTRIQQLRAHYRRWQAHHELSLEMDRRAHTSIQRRQSRQVAAVFQFWRRRVRAAQAQRVAAFGAWKSSSNEAKSNRLLAYRCLHRLRVQHWWQLWLVAHRRQRCAYLAALGAPMRCAIDTASARLLAQSMCFQAWQRRAMVAKTVCMATRNAWLCKDVRKQTRATYFQQWKGVVTSTTLQRECVSLEALALGLSVQLDRLATRRLVICLVTRWCNWATLRGRHRRFLHRVQLQRRTRRLVRMVDVWRQQVHRRARVASLKQSQERSLHVLTIRRWTVLVTWRRQLRLLGARWQRSCRHHCLRSPFDAWRHRFVDHQRACRRGMARCLHKASLAMRRTAWGRWRRAQQRLCDDAATLRLTVVQVWARWQQDVLRARHVRRQLRWRLRGVLQTAMRRAWQVWQTHTIVYRHLALAATMPTAGISTPLQSESSDRATQTDVLEAESAVALKELQATHAALLSLYQQSQRDAAEHVQERELWRRQLDAVTMEKTTLIQVLDECKTRLHTAKHLAHDNRALRALVADTTAQRQQIAQLTGRCVLGERMLQRLELELTNERSERVRELDAHHAHTTELTLQLATVRERCTHLEDMERYNVKLQHTLALQEDRWQRAKLANFEATLQRMDAATKPEP